MTEENANVKLHIVKMWSVLDMRGKETAAYSLCVFTTREDLFVFCKVTGLGWLTGDKAGATENLLQSGQKNLGNQAVLNHAEEYVSMLETKSCAIKVVNLREIP